MREHNPDCICRVCQKKRHAEAGEMGIGLAKFITDNGIHHFNYYNRSEIAKRAKAIIDKLGDGK